MKKFLLFTFLLFVSAHAFSQNSIKVSIKGNVVDTSNTALAFSSVLLLTPADSVLVSFSRTDDKGNFEFKNIKRGKYILKASYVGYLPLQQVFSTAEGDITDLGKVALKPIVKELFEVVVKTAKAPISIKGDTIEYNASSFKVPPGSSVEELLRKLPGMQVDADGNIKAQGQEVKKVTVDGKSFFGSDPKQATKNLPAEAINKVQVFNDKSEQAKITGVDDGKKEKTVNLELKEEFKKGGFGKITAAAGDNERMSLKGNYNKFDKKNQFSVIGFGNNVNQTGLSNADYQDFKGSQSYNWNDNADFGFPLGGMRFFSGDDNSEESFSIPQAWQPGVGFTKNYGGGANYNYDTKDRKISSSYFYSQNRQIMDVLSNSQTFLTNFSYLMNSNNHTESFAQNHRGNFRFEQNLDSLNTLIFIANFRSGNRTLDYKSLADYSTTKSEVFRNQNSATNNATVSSALATSLIYRHKFMKKGRSFAWSGSYNLSKINTEGNQSSIIKEFVVQDVDFSLGNNNLNINQNALNTSNGNQIKSSLLFVEPLSKKFFLETFYNYSQRNDKVDRDIYNLFEASKPRIDSLSRYYVNKIQFNRFGTTIRYNNKGLNIGLGIAAQQYLINGDFYNNQNMPTLGKVNRKYFLLTPDFSFNYEMKNNKFMYLDYDANIQEPTIQQLQPFTDNSNPLFIRNGNPNLLPSQSHGATLAYGMFNPASFVSFWANLYYSYNVNQVIYNQTVDSKLITTATPVNISGGNNFGSYLNYNFPIVKTKLALSFNTGLNFSKNIVYINSILNNNNNQSYNFGGRLDLTPSEKFTLFANAELNTNYAKYSVNTSQNQKYFNHRFGADMNIKFPKDYYFNAKFNYLIYKNERFGFDQQQPILNVSAYKLLGKAKKSEIRFTVYDVFKKNLGIQQSAYENFISRTQTQTLSRYFMLSYTYNMRGITPKMRDNRGW